MFLLPGPSGKEHIPVKVAALADNVQTVNARHLVIRGKYGVFAEKFRI